MILDQIIKHKKDMLAITKQKRNIGVIQNHSVSPVSDFKSALKNGFLSVISEIKRKSPSAGHLGKQFNPAVIAEEYSHNGAAAISVLTDKKYFGGSNHYISQARKASQLPVLRKDFIIDEYQIYESKHIGADAILLIVKILSETQLSDFISLAEELKLHTLVEVHSAKEMQRALKCKADIIGINNRNLDTLEINLETSIELVKQIPDDKIKVSESGIKTRADMIRLESAGFDAVLIGETLMKSADPGLKLKELLGRE